MFYPDNVYVNGKIYSISYNVSNLVLYLIWHNISNYGYSVTFTYILTCYNLENNVCVTL